MSRTQDCQKSELAKSLATVRQAAGVVTRQLSERLRSILVKSSIAELARELLRTDDCAMSSYCPDRGRRSGCSDCRGNIHDV